MTSKPNIKKILSNKQSNASVKEASLWGKFVPGLAAIASFYAIATPLLYMNGSAFHSGYLGHFSLQESMFPMDVATTCLQAIFAWTLFLEETFPALAHFLSDHWFAISLVVSSVILIFSIAASIDESNKKKQAGSASNGSAYSVERKISFISRILSNLFRYASLAYWTVTIALMTVGLFVVVVLFLIGPFQKTGSEFAVQDEKDGFSHSPEVIVTSPDGTKSKFRIIECYGNFCAIYKDHHAYAIPASAVTWASIPEQQVEPAHATVDPKGAESPSR
jgi:hypothetical protein